MMSLLINKRINIVFISSKLPFGGAERQWLELIRGLDKTKFKIVVVTLYELGGIGEEIKKLGIVTYSKVLPRKLYIHYLINVVKILKEEQADIVFLMNQPLSVFYGVIAASVAKIKRIFTAVHNTVVFKKRRRRFILNQLFVGFFDYIIAVGEKQRDYLIESQQLPCEKIKTIVNGVDVSGCDVFVKKDTMKRSLDIPENFKVVGIVGRLDRVKRHDIFLEAAEIILKEFPSVKFLVVGEGAERERIERLIESLKLSNEVKILGFRSDIPQINKILDVSVISSESEALPMSILEAMGARVPVVATDVGSVSEAVLDGKTGFLVPPNTPEKLAEAILVLLRNNRLAKEFGVEGRRVVEDKFSLQKMICDYEKLFYDKD